MADEHVTAEDFLEYLKAQTTMTFSCPMCSKSAFTFVDGTTMPYIVNYLAIIDDGAPKLTGKSLSALAMTCNTCGYIMSFSVPHIRRWLSERK